MNRDETGFEWPSYDPNIDYKSLVYNHLSKGEWSAYKNDKNEIEIMFRRFSELYKQLPDPNKQWYRMAVSERKTEWRKKKSETFFHIPKQKQIETDVWLFVTINLNDTKLPETDYADAMKSIVDAVLTSKDKNLCSYQMRMVIEKHKEEGIHHHIHLLMIGKNKQGPKYIIQRLWRMAAVKYIVDKPNFIDVKLSWSKDKEHRAADLLTCQNYISGDKGTDIKIQNVEKDKIWRELNALKHEYNNL